MKISQLCLLLRKYYPCSFMYDDPDTEVYAFKTCSSTSAMEEDYLYILEEKTCVGSPTQVSGKITNILIYTEEERPPFSRVHRLFTHANLIWIKKSREDGISSLYGTLSDIFLSESRYTSQIRRLTQMSASGRGMYELINEAAHILEAHIIVIDSSYQLLAMSNYQKGAEVSGLEEQRRIGAITEENLNRLQREHIYDKIRRQPDRLFYNIAPDATYWWVNMLIHVHGIEVAEMGIAEIGRKFTEYDFELMKHLRHLISLELQQGNKIGDSFGFAHNILVAELLDQTNIMPDLLRYRSGLLGWTAAAFYYVLTIFPKTGHDHVPKHFQRRAQILSIQLSHQLPQSYWRVGLHDLVFIIPLDSRNGQDLLRSPRLSELLADNNMLGILSNPVSDLMKVRDAYQQTTILYNLREVLPGSTPLHQYADYSIIHMASILQQSHSPESFCHPLFLTIRDYDRAHHTDYAATLYEYLVHLDDPSTIAAHLNIHKNTVYYRINRMKELFPMDLNDGSLRMKLLASMELMRLETAFREER